MMGRTESIKLPTTEGMPIVNGEDWFKQTDYITSVCTDTTKCGGYVNRWMGAGNGFYERAAEYFKGQFEGLGYETFLLRVTDHGNLAQPESLNVSRLETRTKRQLRSRNGRTHAGGPLLQYDCCMNVAMLRSCVR